jgi:hypothetical protein
METNQNIISKETGHNNNHHHIKTNRTLTSQVSTGSNHKWWNTWWKTKNHSKDVERRKSSTSASIASNGDFFSEDVSYYIISLFK